MTTYEPQDPVVEIEGLSIYTLTDESLATLKVACVKAIRRLRVSPSEEARAIGAELQQAYLDLSREQRTNCDLHELWGDTMEPPEPREVQAESGHLLSFSTTTSRD